MNTGGFSATYSYTSFCFPSFSLHFVKQKKDDAVAWNCSVFLCWVQLFRLSKIRYLPFIHRKMITILWIFSFRCQIAVHQECYGARNVRNFTSWVCRACETPDVKRECCLCPVKGMYPWFTAISLFSLSFAFQVFISFLVNNVASMYSKNAIAFSPSLSVKLTSRGIVCLVVSYERLPRCSCTSYSDDICTMNLKSLSRFSSSTDYVRT